MLLLRYETKPHQTHPRECADEFGVVDHIKSFVKIKCLGQCAEWGTELIKVLSYIMCKMLESGYGGVVGTEAMLSG